MPVSRSPWLHRFFQPRTIAVVGVSRQRGKLGTRIFHNLIDGGFTGHIIPVNPKAKRLYGQPAYPDVASLPKRPDLVIVVTPAESVPAIVRQCGELNIRHIVVISSGFREVDAAGEKREKILQELVRRFHLSLLGPNSLGFLHGGNRMNASFAQALPRVGSVTVLSQSGAMAVAITDWARDSGVGIRSVVSMGNKAGLDESTLLEYFGRDPETEVIVVYLESLEQGRRFLDVAAAVVRKKPVVVLHAGETAPGQAAMRSHTGALATEQKVLAAGLRQAGVLQVHRIEELADVAVIFAHTRRLSGNRLALLTNAGGPGIMAADTLAQTSLTASSFSRTTHHRLQTFLPSAAALRNPLDIIGDADPRRFRLAIRHLLTDAGVDALLVILTPQVVTNPSGVAQEVVKAQRRFPKKTVLASFLGGRTVSRARNILEKAQIAHFDYPEDAIRSLDRLWQYVRFRKSRTRVRGSPGAVLVTTRQKQTVSRLLQKNPVVLPPASQDILRRYGFSTLPERLSHSEAETLRVAQQIGYPIVLKFISPDLLHKTDHQAVWVDLPDRSALRSTFRQGGKRFRRFLKNPSAGWLVQPFLRSRTEIFLGGKRDPTFGPVVLIGLGGVDVELLGQTLTLLAPISAAAASQQLQNSALMPWLQRRRGQLAIDRRQLANLIARLGQLLTDHPTVAEIDVNPLLLNAHGRLTAVDSRILQR